MRSLYFRALLTHKVPKVTSPCYAGFRVSKTISKTLVRGEKMPARQAAPCLRCGETIDINEAAFVADIRLRTVGLEDALRSPSASVSICFTCGDLMAKGDEPPQRTRPLDHIVYTLMQEMVTSDLSISLVSWIELRQARGLPAPTL